LWEKGHEIRQRKDGALVGGLAAIGSDGFTVLPAASAEQSELLLLAQ